MKNYLVKELLNEMNEDKLEIIDYQTIELADRIAAYTSFVDIKYMNRLRDMELINSIKAYNDEIKKLIDRINEIEAFAIKNKNENFMFTCENRKSTLLNLMMYLQETYL